MLHKNPLDLTKIKREFAILDLIYLQFKMLEIINEMIGFIYKTELVE